MSTHGRATKAQRRDSRRRAKLRQASRCLHAYARTVKPIYSIEGAGDRHPRKRFKVVAHRNTSPEQTMAVFETDDHETALAFCKRFPENLREQDKNIPPGSYILLRDYETNERQRFSL